MNVSLNYKARTFFVARMCFPTQVQSIQAFLTDSDAEFCWSEYQRRWWWWWWWWWRRVFFSLSWRNKQWRHGYLIPPIPSCFDPASVWRLKIAAMRVEQMQSVPLQHARLCLHICYSHKYYIIYIHMYRIMPYWCNRCIYIHMYIYIYVYLHTDTCTCIIGVIQVGYKAIYI